MARQTIESGLILFLVAASGVVLLRPDWFPDIPLSAAVVHAEWARWAIGGFLMFMVGLALTRIVMDGHLAHGRVRRPGPVRTAAGALSDEERAAILAAPGLEALAPPVEDYPAEPPPIEEEPAKEEPAEPDLADQEEMADLRAALQAARYMQSADPEDLRSHVEAAEVLARLAAKAERAGRIDEALGHLEEGVRMTRAAVVEAPFDARLAEGAAVAVGRLADCRKAAGDIEQAERLYVEAVRLARRAAWLDPTSEAVAQAVFDAESRYADWTDRRASRRERAVSPS